MMKGVPHRKMGKIFDVLNDTNNTWLSTKKSLVIVYITLHNKVKKHTKWSYYMGVKSEVSRKARAIN